MAQINKPGLHFNTKLYTGNNSTNAITGVGFQPGFVWLKPRNANDNHRLMNAVSTAGYYLASNATSAETGTGSNFASFDSDGFTLGGSDGGWNSSSYNYASWNWKANGAGSSNSDGSVTSTVSVNTTAGFSICGFTQASSGSFTFGHGLGVAPDMIIGKSRGNTSNWQIYHKELGTGKFIQLNSTAAQQTVANFWGTIDTSIVTIGSNQLEASQPSVYFCFAEKKGYSKFGKYIGNGNVSGTFVYTGFSPAFVMTKRSDNTSDWLICDNKRPGYNVINKKLFPNLTQAEDSYDSFDFVSNGFKIRSSGSGHNASGGTFIYMAFAENPIVGTNNVAATAR